MNRRLIALTLMLILAAGQPAAAAPVSVTRDDQREVMVTIYNGNLGLVKDLREARLPAGVNEVQFMDVAAGIDPTTVHLKSLPENLVAKPTLVWLLRNQTARPQRMEASYLTSGITWKADYVMVLNAADSLSDLTGWVTIDNKSGATYGNAALKLVAGDVNRAQDARRDQ